MYTADLAFYGRIGSRPDVHEAAEALDVSQENRLAVWTCLPITSVWAVPAGGGEERQVFPAMFAQNMIVRKSGIYFVLTRTPATHHDDRELPLSLQTKIVPQF